MFFFINFVVAPASREIVRVLFINTKTKLWNSKNQTPQTAIVPVTMRTTMEAKIGTALATGQSTTNAKRRPRNRKRPPISTLAIVDGWQMALSISVRDAERQGLTD